MVATAIELCTCKNINVQDCCRLWKCVRLYDYGRDFVYVAIDTRNAYSYI